MSYNVKLFFDDDHEAEITCEADEDIITAALRQGLILMSECREGVCATCKCFLADGEYGALLPHSVYALTPSDEEEGFVLGCRLRPTSDLELEFDYPFTMVQQYVETERRGRLLEVAMVSETVARVVVQTMGAQDVLRYLPGQFVRLTLENGVSRDFSMANVCDDSRQLEFYIRVYPDGKFSSYISRDACVGEAINVHGPLGSFILRGNDHTPVFIVGGTGLAPVLAMLRDMAANQPDRHAVLIFGNTNVGDVFGVELLEGLGKQLPNLKVLYGVINPDESWTGDVGTATAVAERFISATDRSQFEYYYCGPPKMIEATTEMLEAAGVARELRHHEDFVPSKLEESNG
ncbi:2Fe-2S iron-sulfur cluster binding domain-containing protein [Candidatus Mycobacterium methanotrophicum]|uniref:2Fe-2S iron-sulfur cluster binding domain-containing protein n=1 Tax=Candidatus Mycobacterium methanotrophicum TaxID=2943498 RepID=A0ABY4QKV1_9MYCO|nr:2Fe-2S iron-sulfur cluster binding domain-containing protein [Candidatus Mycobacterium methanotrophicum]UQX11660.1 2Fe-2S iron-sulfur cluster binding domain-containing protein [Candidatus Mycobacterium methanotrophicum]